MEKIKKYLLAVVEGKREDKSARLTLFFLSILEVLYFLLIELRGLLYKIRVLKKKSLACKVISVGNITAGGTGKTPVVSYLAQTFFKLGKNVVVVSRGYGAASKGPLVVSDGKKFLVDVKEAGDEPSMLYRLLPSVPIVIGQERWQAGSMAIDRFKPDIILLDDGFQHWQLERDIDIVVLDALKPFGFNHLLPRGLLREPLKALKRAQVIIISKANYLSDKKVKQLKEKVRLFNEKALILSSSYLPAYFRKIKEEKEKHLSFAVLADKRVLAFSGIGNPESFARSLDELGIIPVEVINYPDHYNYTDKDFVNLAKRVQDEKIDWLVTTEKDAVKIFSSMLEPLNNIGAEIVVLGMSLEISAEEELISQLID